VLVDASILSLVEEVGIAYVSKEVCMADTIDVEEIQAAVRSSDADWVAGSTALTVLTESQRRRRLGYVPGPDEPPLEAREQLASTNYEATGSARNIGAPASFDLRSVDGKNYITSVKDQGNCGSCVAFGTNATVEGTLRFSKKDANLAVDYSEAHLFYCQARAQGRRCSGANGGWWVPPALDCFKNTGVTAEQCYPYTAGDQNCTGLCSDWQKQATKITSWREIISIADMKGWLSTKGPLVACFTVYSDFYAYKTGVYRYVSGTREGGHCICCVGYDDTQGCWICKNSWGSDNWGDLGFFRIAYGQCGIDAVMWGVEGIVPPDSGGWQKNQRVTSLWGISEPRNAWVFVDGLGWRKITPEPDIFPHLLALLVAAKTAGSRVDFREENQVIKEVYVF
jgi:C1A family cysteine protease